MKRRAEYRPFSWLNDLYVRRQLDLSPPYQRRSVWPERYKSQFITTILLDYPCPAIFLYEEIRADGSFLYKVVDGKQRLSTLFDFVGDRISIENDYPREQWRGMVFGDLPDDAKRGVWRYSFSVEFIEQENEALINDIFNRINSNVARLTPQELRHAMFSGHFIQTVEALATFTEETLGSSFPYIAPQSRRQMKDVENVVLLVLFLELGERSLSQIDIDRAFRDREDEWEGRARWEKEYTNVIYFLEAVLNHDTANIIRASRLRNQADFYSLFAALAELKREDRMPTPQFAGDRLIGWIGALAAVHDDEGENPLVSGRNDGPEVDIYLQAARAASNDAGPRRRRIDIMKTVLTES